MSSVKQVPKIYRRFITVIVATTVVPFAMHCTFAQQKSDEELVKELNNPVGSLISVPFQNNFEFKLEPNNNGFRKHAKLSACYSCFIEQRLEPHHSNNRSIHLSTRRDWDDRSERS